MKGRLTPPPVRRRYHVMCNVLRAQGVTVKGILFSWVWKGEWHSAALGGLAHFWIDFVWGNFSDGESRWTPVSSVLSAEALWSNRRTGNDLREGQEREGEGKRSWVKHSLFPRFRYLISRRGWRMVLRGGRAELPHQDVVQAARSVSVQILN